MVMEKPKILIVILDPGVAMPSKQRDKIVYFINNLDKNWLKERETHFLVYENFSINEINISFNDIYKLKGNWNLFLTMTKIIKKLSSSTSRVIVHLIVTSQSKKMELFIFFIKWIFKIFRKIYKSGLILIYLTH